jgi:hypothetical protein
MGWGRRRQLARVGLANAGAFPAVALEAPGSDGTAMGVAIGMRAHQLTGDGALRAFAK